MSDSDLSIDDIADLIAEGLEQRQHFDAAAPEALKDVDDAIQEFATDWRDAGGVCTATSTPAGNPVEYTLALDRGPHDYIFAKPFTITFKVDRARQCLLIDDEPYELGLDESGVIQVILEKLADHVRKELLLDDDSENDEEE